MMMNKSVILWTTLVVVLIGNCSCPPVNPNSNNNNNDQDANNHDKTNEKLENDPILALEYHRYLREVVNVLETDPKFKELIEKASADDIKTGKIADHLDLVSHNVRTKLDELKRKEMDRLRHLISRKVALNAIKPHDIESLLPKHVDHQNVETFESKDLESLIKQATTDLEEIDKIRREEFKQHEIEKEFERRKHLNEMDPEARKRAEAEYQRQMEQRKHHPKVNHPGSKDQLEEVWEEQDQLKGEQFDPKTFFSMHDLDGNKYLDASEIEALFQIELDKIYNTSDPNYDPVERDEEMNRMREHVFNEIDKDKDGAVSWQEFMDATKEKEFEKNPEWKSLEDEPQFNQKEFEDFSRSHQQVEDSHTQPTPIQQNNQQFQQQQNNNQFQQQQQQQQQHHQQQFQQQPNQQGAPHAQQQINQNQPNLNQNHNNNVPPMAHHA